MVRNNSATARIRPSDETVVARQAFEGIVALEKVRGIAWRGNWSEVAAAIAAAQVQLDAMRVTASAHLEGGR